MNAVKPLEWCQLYPEHRMFPKDWHGTGILRSRYVVKQNHPDGPFYFGERYSTLGEAKAAAQSLYDKEVISAIADLSAQAAELERLREALEPFAHIGGSEALLHSVPPSMSLIAHNGPQRAFAVDWSCFVAANAALNPSDATEPARAALAKEQSDV